MLVEAPQGFDARHMPPTFPDATTATGPGWEGSACTMRHGDTLFRVEIRNAGARQRAAVLIPLDGGEELRIAELRRFIRYLSGLPVPPLSRALGLPLYRARFIADAICAYAGRRAGASQREIGAVLDPSVRQMNARQWDTSSQRGRIGRLLRKATHLADERKYLTLLRPSRFRLSP
ncbi:DUF2285 domain-containing protein [Komagataeibacter oboediens]|uniref:DUF2285 domain-containing protein n=1 Tax=Komagataeibacter oboediens TaxID=65958 RepID=UPI001C2BFE75|nr:DUF2285 domain-containing protein [Komagataeibacter oboediens]MBV0888821.1 DUF2285 domain-containing protein [Komagataeibacter oboediens]MCK9821533.1 DUF2285 domain-containing protein [Komagataeibacter oboediens]